MATTHIIPPYLKKGDTIGITCPAGYMAREKAQACIDTLQSWGFQVMVGHTLGSDSQNYFSGSDEERRDELQAMLDDSSIKAILCGRGGYGVSRIIDQLDFRRFKKNPKWIIGYSDITVLHCHLNRRLTSASLHAPMAGAFNDMEGGAAYNQSILKAITGKSMRYKAAAHPFNQTGTATGELIGGNLSLLVHLIGTASAIATTNKILFIEDVGEFTYAIDRMLLQLKRSGKLDQLAGLIIGGFTDIKDTERPFGSTVYEAIHHLLQEYNYPICFDFPVSHSPRNYALKCGVVHTLKVTKNQVLLQEESTTIS